MSGTVNVARDLWDDPTFKDSEMSQREAWIWMIAEASWKDRTRRVGSHEVELKRGQLAASSRFMAAAFMWSEPRVRRYLDMLENRRMISRVTDAGVSVITICKYDDYQNAPRVDDAPPTQQPTQDRRTADANDNKGIKISSSSSGRAGALETAEVPPSSWTPDRLYDEVLAAVGLTSGRMPAYWMPPAAPIHIWRWHADLGLSPEQIIDCSRQNRAQFDTPPDGPKALDRAMQRLSAVLTASPLEQAAGQQARASPPQAAFPRIRAQLPTEAKQ